MGMFDDLIPSGSSVPEQKSPTGGAALSFDDLIPKEKPYSGSILPMSRDAQGNVSFDSNAGILGTIKRAITLPGDAYNGKVKSQDEMIARSMDLAGLISPVNPAVRAGDMASGALFRGQKPGTIVPPTANELRSASKAGYNSAREMGVDYSSKAVGDLATGIRSKLEQDGILAELAPKSFSVLEKLSNPPKGSVVPFGGLEAARRAFGNAGKDFGNPTDQLAARRIVQAIDDFMSSGDPGAVVAGPAEALAKTVKNARGNYAAAMRSDKLAGIEDAANLRAAAANSGQNVENSVRGRIASMLLKPKDLAGFSKEEIGMLRDVAEGTPSRNAVRYIGNLLGGGGGLGQLAATGLGGATGMASAGPLGAAAGAALPAIVGMSAKKIGNALTERSFARADQAVRMRSPLAETLLREAPPVEISPAKRAILIRALLGSRPPESSN